MPIITKPSSIQKNQICQFILNKSELLEIQSVSGDDYFSDSTNWEEVLIYYKSSEGNQREILSFDVTLASPTADFLISDKARSNFMVQKIVIRDFDAGYLTIQRSELNVNDFDIDATPIPSTLMYSRNFNSSLTGEQFSNSSIVNGNLVFTGGQSMYHFSIPNYYNTGGALTIKLYISSNSLSGDGGEFRAGFSLYNYPTGPMWGFGTSSSPESLSGIVSFNATNGQISSGLFQLLLQEGYTGVLSISKIEIYEGFDQ